MKISKLSSSQILVLGFFGIILTGALLLSLPISSVYGQWTNFLDCLFTSTSAVCVTGLILFDTGTYWTLFGKIVIITLIQIGGLGFMSMTILAALITKSKISLSQRLVMSEALGANAISGIVKLSKRVIELTVFIEFLGIISLCIFFIPKFGAVTGLWYALFHSISAFCNAGFDLLGGYSSFTKYSNSYILNITIMLLIIFGGLGFSVIINVVQSGFRYKKFTLHSKLVLITTGILIIVPMIIFLLLENNNTLYGKPIGEKLLASAFQVVSPRTAGFNSLNITKFRQSSLFLQIILMIIGGSPASTAGGLKTVTVAVLFLNFIGFFKKDDNIQVMNRRISDNFLKNAVIILSWALVLITSGLFIISAVQPELEFLDIFYEVASAYGTVGLSTGITRSLNFISKVVLIIIMFSGRVGSLTIIIAFSDMAKAKKSKVLFPKEEIVVG